MSDEDDDVTYSSNENYLNYNALLVKKEDYEEGGGEGADDRRQLYLEPGDYSYPFRIALPDNLPSSFEHTTGHVRYLISVTIDIPM
jgi:hypothetical protein